jgi:trans-aconitate 2-methyltransferase
MVWSASQYLAFGGERTRAAADLLARVPCESPSAVVDLGCGPGNSTEILVARYPDANVIGLDTSEDMLARARKNPRLGRASFVEGDVATWTPEAPVDLVFANAVLHWLPDHASLFPRLVRGLAKGGVLAAQMPKNFDAPTHRLLGEVAAEPPWANLLERAIPPVSVLDAAPYQRLLRGFGRVDVWETEYLHTLEGPDPVLAWVRGTALVPVREALPREMYAAFEVEYGARLREAYPPEEDGTTLLPFRRIFIVLAT